MEREDKEGFIRDVGYSHVQAKQHTSSCEPSKSPKFTPHLLKQGCAWRLSYGVGVMDSAGYGRDGFSRHFHHPHPTLGVDYHLMWSVLPARLLPTYLPTYPSIMTLRCPFPIEAAASTKVSPRTTLSSPSKAYKDTAVRRRYVCV